MKTKSMTIQKLQTDLCKFGLNPADWNIEYIEALRYLIRSKKDRSLSLYGRLQYKNKKPTWKSIDLITL